MKYTHYFRLKRAGVCYNSKLDLLMEWIETLANNPRIDCDRRYTVRPRDGIRGCWLTEEDATMFTLLFGIKGTKVEL